MDHVVTFISPYCYVRLTYDTPEEAQSAVDGCNGGKWNSLIGVVATYHGPTTVRSVQLTEPVRPRATLMLEPVEVLDLFFNDFPGHWAARRMT
jgi:hypothetical protein